MAITFGDHLIDSGHHDITPEQERAREECERRLSVTCSTCGGRGEIGWYDAFEAAYRNEPCPDCYRCPDDCGCSCSAS